MIKKFYLLLLILFRITGIGHAQPTIQERLGYSKESKLLIIHADDLAVAHAEDQASFDALKAGNVRSASIMVPCPWLTEVAAYAQAHPGADLGLHLTLTSEWNTYKWGPVAGVSRVPSLVNHNGYFYSTVDSLYQHARIEDVETEVEAQIQKAMEAGIHPTHLDSHMGSLFARADYLQVLIRAGRKYHLPVLLNVPVFKMIYNLDITPYLGKQEVPVNQVFMASPSDYAGGMEKYYTRVFQSIRPGLACLILHAAYDNDEMKAITVDHPDYGAAWRQADYDFFSSAKCRELLETNHIRVITWKEVKEKLFQGQQ